MPVYPETRYLEALEAHGMERAARLLQHDHPEWTKGQAYTALHLMLQEWVETTGSLLDLLKRSVEEAKQLKEKGVGH